mmetsp:Transcript_8321/g.12121  ORF Transcript_8321/g.12121 Transcript_8321/m.12121 type:complete len:240 (-) Transcript_8321:170-889(-)
MLDGTALLLGLDQLSGRAVGQGVALAGGAVGVRLEKRVITADLSAQSLHDLPPCIVAGDAVVVAAKSVLKNLRHPDTNVQVVVPSEDLGVEVGLEVDVDDALGQVLHGVVDQLALVIVDDLAVAVGVEGVVVLVVLEDGVAIPGDFATVQGTNLQLVIANEGAAEDDVVHGTHAVGELGLQEAGLHLDLLGLDDPSDALPIVPGVLAVESLEVRCAPHQAGLELGCAPGEVFCVARALA